MIQKIQTSLYSSGSSNDNLDQSLNRSTKKSEDFIYQIFSDSKAKINPFQKEIIKNNIFNVFNISYITEGSQGQVYMANMLDKSFKKFKCAIKIISLLSNIEHKKQLEIFQKEIDIRKSIDLIEKEYNKLNLSQRDETINPQGIVKYYYDFKTEQGYSGVVMEYCNETLESLMKSETKEIHEDIYDTFINKCNSVRDLCFMQLILKTLQALNFLHFEDFIGNIQKEGYIHRDLKPMNIMIQIDRVNEFSVKIIDLGGISKQSKDDSNDDEDYFQGTMAFYPPEYIKLELDIFDKSSDVWAMGICIYRLLAVQEKDKVKLNKKNLLQRIDQIKNRLDPKTLQKQEGNERDQLVYESCSKILEKLLTLDYKLRNQKNYLKDVIEIAQECIKKLQTKLQRQVLEKEPSKPQTESLQLKEMCQNPNFIIDSLEFLRDLSQYCYYRQNLEDYKIFFQVFAGFLNQNFKSYSQQIQNLNIYRLNIQNNYDFQNSKICTLNLLKKMLFNIHEQESALNVQDKNTQKLIWCTYYLSILYKLEYYKYYNIFDECIYYITSYSDIQKMNLLEIQLKIKKLLFGDAS
ncbi:hypothetical protein ABPG72_014641 [Tetrahymena utriculariae]